MRRTLEAVEMDFFNSCVITPPTSNDGYEDSYNGSGSSTVRCKIRSVTKKTTPMDNKVTSYWIAFPPKTTITEDYRVTIDNVTYDIIEFKRVVSLNSEKTDYYRVIIGEPSYGGAT